MFIYITFYHLKNCSWATIFDWETFQWLESYSAMRRSTRETSVQTPLDLMLITPYVLQAIRFAVSKPIDTARVPK